MASKRPWTHKCLTCRCQKQSTLLIGIKGFDVMTVTLFIGGSVFLFQVLTAQVGIEYKIFFVAFGSIAIAIHRWTYLDYKKLLQKYGHSRECSKYVAFRAALCTAKYIRLTEENIRKGSV